MDGLTHRRPNPARHRRPCCRARRLRRPRHRDATPGARAPRSPAACEACSVGAPPALRCPSGRTRAPTSRCAMASADDRYVRGLTTRSVGHGEHPAGRGRGRRRRHIPRPPRPRGRGTAGSRATIPRPTPTTRPSAATRIWAAATAAPARPRPSQHRTAPSARLHAGPRCPRAARAVPSRRPARARPWRSGS